MFELVGIYSSFVMSFRLVYVNLVCQTVKLRVGHCLVAPEPSTSHLKPGVILTCIGGV